MQTKKIRPTLLAILIFQSTLGFSQEIFTAIMQGNAERAKQLIETDPQNAINKNSQGFSPIHFAANFNQLEVAKLLFEKGVDPFGNGPLGRNSLHWAASTGSLDILKWLNGLEPNLNVKDAANKTPIYLAATRGHKTCVDFLLSQNVILETEGGEAFDLLYSSISFGLNGVIQKFIDSDFDFQQLSNNGSSLLFPAAQNGNTDLMPTLINRGININHLNDFGECALHISIKQKQLDALRKMVDLGADVNLPNFVGQNALSITETMDLNEFKDYLLYKGATPPKGFSLNKKYPDIEEPGLTPKLFAPGLISTPDFDERDVMFSPDMDEFYFTKYSRAKQVAMTVTKMTKQGKLWSKPETAKFSGAFNDAECFIGFNNQNLYFISQRPYDGSNKPTNWEIWVADRTNEDWGNERLLDTTNLKGCFYPSLTKKDELLYTGVGNDLYLSKLKDGKVEDIVKLGSEINTAQAEYNAMISPDGDYIIFTSHGFEDHYGAGDLYISFRKKDNTWTQAINMGSEINTKYIEYCPNISPDGKYFFFTSNKKGTEDIYWVDGSVIEQLRSISFKTK